MTTRNIASIAALVCTVLLPNTVEASNYFKFLNTTIQLADSSSAAVHLSVKEPYLNSFSTFDYAGRFQDNNTHTVDDYLKLAVQQTLDWTAEEEQMIQTGFAEIETFITENKLQLLLPDTIPFIKSTCKEEFSAGGYTRRNCIVIKRGEALEASLIAHELFHVLTRNNPTLRDKLYKNIGFNKCNNIEVTPVMGGLNITNPDCPIVCHYINVDGEDLVLLLHSKKPYKGGPVFADDYITISLMKVEGADNNKKAALKNNKPVLYTIEERLGLMKQIGVNTDYILHPEEICAEHFAALVTNRAVPQPEFLDKMKEQLK